MKKEEILREAREIFRELEESENIKTSRTITERLFERHDIEYSQRTVQEWMKEEFRGRLLAKNQYSIKPINSVLVDKKIGSFDFKEWADLAIRKQELKQKASFSQKEATIEIKSEVPLIILFLADLHIGSIGSNYYILLAVTELLKKYPFIKVIFVGDLNDNFVRFKSMKAVHSQVFNPEEQLEFLLSWVDYIRDSILAATWCNHSEFTEHATGLNPIKKILSERMVYFDGIGKANLKLNEIEYKFCLTHKTRRWSSFNTTHGLKQLAREDVQGCDIYVGADRHQPAYSKEVIAGDLKTFIQCGTWKLEDSYSQRYFSYITRSEMPCVVLNPTTHKVTPFGTIDEALEFVK